MIETGGPDFHPDARLVTGVETDPNDPETVRVFLGARHLGVHTHVKDPAAISELRRAWDTNVGHLTTRVPKGALCVCDATPGQRAAFYGLES